MSAANIAVDVESMHKNIIRNVITEIAISFMWICESRSKITFSPYTCILLYLPSWNLARSGDLAHHYCCGQLASFVIAALAYHFVFMIKFTQTLCLMFVARQTRCSYALEMRGGGAKHSDRSGDICVCSFLPISIERIVEHVFHISFFLFHFDLMCNQSVIECSWSCSGFGIVAKKNAKCTNDMFEWPSNSND